MSGIETSFSWILKITDDEYFGITLERKLKDLCSWGLQSERNSWFFTLFQTDSKRGMKKRQSNQLHEKWKHMSWYVEKGQSKMKSFEQTTASLKDEPGPYKSQSNPNSHQCKHEICSCLKRENFTVPFQMTSRIWSQKNLMLPRWWSEGFQSRQPAWQKKADPSVVVSHYDECKLE